MHLLTCGLPYLSSRDSQRLLLLISRSTKNVLNTLSQFPLLPATAERCLALPARVLTVGDGNLSFSLSLCHILRAIVPQSSMMNFVATTFDDKASLCIKYPESEKIITKLLEKGVEIHHQINAVALPPRIGSFSIIVFNHPHLGIEDAACHRILLAHFFHSCLSHLRSGSQVFVSLVEGQPERWKLVEEASRAGFALVRTLLMDASMFPEYEIKRTHSGRSFVSVHSKKQSNYSQSSTFFCFVRKQERHLYTQHTSKKRKRYQQHVSTTSSSGRGGGRGDDDDGGGGGGGSGGSAGGAGRGGPHRGGSGGSGGSVGGGGGCGSSRKSSHTNSTTLSGEADTRNTCIECQRSFSTSQGLKTHQHQVHVLNLYSNNKQAHCSICSRDFASETALHQHTLAKHGADQSIQPHSKQYAPTSSSLTTTLIPVVALHSFQCKICRNSFSDQLSFDSHISSLEPVVLKPSHVCPQCGRTFGDDRALRQHHNFCFTPVRRLSKDGDEKERK